MSLQFQTKIDKSGRVLLPQEVLSDLHLLPGANLLIEEEEGKITLKPIEEEPVLIEKDGILVIHGQITEDITDIVEKDRDNRISNIIRDSFKCQCSI